MLTVCGSVTGEVEGKEQNVLTLKLPGEIDVSISQILLLVSLMGLNTET